MKENLPFTECPLYARYRATRPPMHRFTGTSLHSKRWVVSVRVQSIPPTPISAAQNNKGLFLAHAAQVNTGCAPCGPHSDTQADVAADISIVTCHQGQMAKECSEGCTPAIQCYSPRSWTSDTPLSAHWPE